MMEERSEGIEIKDVQCLKNPVLTLVVNLTPILDSSNHRIRNEI